MAEAQQRIPVLPGNAQLPLVSFASSQVMLKGEVRSARLPMRSGVAEGAVIREPSVASILPSSE